MPDGDMTEVGEKGITVRLSMHSFIMGTNGVCS